MTTPNSDSLSPEEVRKLEEQVDSLQLRLEGNIFLIQCDKDGKELLKDEIDGEVCLKLINYILEDSIKEQLKNENVVSKSQSNV